MLYNAIICRGQCPKAQKRAMLSVTAAIQIGQFKYGLGRMLLGAMHSSRSLVADSRCPILAGTQSLGDPISKTCFGISKNSCSNGLLKKGLWRPLVLNVSRGPNVDYGLCDWGWTPSRCHRFVC